MICQEAHFSQLTFSIFFIGMCALCVFLGLFFPPWPHWLGILLYILFCQHCFMAIFRRPLAYTYRYFPLTMYDHISVSPVSLGIHTWRVAETWIYHVDYPCLGSSLISWWEGLDTTCLAIHHPSTKLASIWKCPRLFLILSSWSYVSIQRNRRLDMHAPQPHNWGENRPLLLPHAINLSKAEQHHFLINLSFQSPGRRISISRTQWPRRLEVIRQ